MTMDDAMREERNGYPARSSQDLEYGSDVAETQGDFEFSEAEEEHGVLGQKNHNTRPDDEEYEREKTAYPKRNLPKDQSRQHIPREGTGQHSSEYAESYRAPKSSRRTELGPPRPQPERPLENSHSGRDRGRSGQRGIDERSAASMAYREYSYRDQDGQNQYMLGNKAMTAVYGHHPKDIQEIATLKAQLDAQKRELDGVREELGKLQKAGLSNIDRYAATLDTDIIRGFRTTEVEIKKFTRYLIKHTRAEIPKEDWSATMIKRSWPEAFDQKAGTIDPAKDDGECHRQIWATVIWKLLDEEFINDPLLSFGGPLAEKVRESYQGLFTDPEVAEESAKWRASSVQLLTKSGVSKFDRNVVESVTSVFKNLFKELGYTLKQEGYAAEIQKRFQTVVKHAMALSQSFASQRATFKLYVPSLDKHKVVKKLDDPEWTTVDSEFQTVDCELEGEIWHVGIPGLIKYEVGGLQPNSRTVLVKPFVVVRE